MSFIQTEKPFSKRWLVSYSLVTLGAFIMAAGFVLFINPYNIVPGGIVGLSIIMHHLTQDMFSFWPNGAPIGLIALVINIPLTFIGVKVLGPRYGAKTITGFILTSIFIDLLTQLIGNVDPMGLENDLLLSSIFGGVSIGIGLGLIYKSKASSGGSDLISMILSKWTKWPLGQLLIYVDSTIIIIGLIVFKDWKIPLYSWLVIYVTGKAVDMAIEGMNYEKLLMIVSDKPEEIRDKIINDLNRGGTFLIGEGMFQGKPKKMIHTIVNRRELSMLEDFIQRIDPEAFLTVVDAREILGNGFKSLEEKVKAN